MKIAIVSDSHDNAANLEKVINWLNQQGIKTLLHAGDLCAPSMVPKVLSKFGGRAHVILGNVGDHETLEEMAGNFDKINYYGKMAELEFEGQKIGLVHEPEHVDELLAKGGFDLIVYGHTHQSEVREEGETKVVNPGTAGGLFNEPTFAIYDTEDKSCEIKRVGEV